MEAIREIVLGIHLVAAMFFVGGSLFVWLVVIPASYRLTSEEGRRTEIVGSIARTFGKLIGPTIVVLIASGIYNATWYLSSASELVSNPHGALLLAKSIATTLLLIMIFVHDVHYSRKIGRLAREGRVAELNAVRKTSRLLSYATVLLMAGVVVLVILMQESG